MKPFLIEISVPPSTKIDTHFQQESKDQRTYEDFLPRETYGTGSALGGNTKFTKMEKETTDDE